MLRFCFHFQVFFIAVFSKSRCNFAYARVKYFTANISKVMCYEIFIRFLDDWPTDTKDCSETLANQQNHT